MPYLAPKRCTICSQVLSMNWKRPVAVPVLDLGVGLEGQLLLGRRRQQEAEIHLGRGASAWRMPRVHRGIDGAAGAAGDERGAGIGSGNLGGNAGNASRSLGEKWLRVDEHRALPRPGDGIARSRS